MIKEKNIHNIFIYFLFIHLGIWTLIPSFTNTNLPLDTIEHLAWSSNLAFGYSKHPPLIAFILEIFYQIFGSQDWAYYLLSQIFVIVSFFFIWRLSNEFFKKKIYSLISILLIEGIYFYNYTTPEFNVNVCLLPFWSATVYYFWKCLDEDKNKNWILLGLFSALGFLSKYLFVYLIIPIVIFFLLKIYKEKKFNYNYITSIVVFLLIISPHLIWLIENNYSTILYAFKRAGVEKKNYIDHLINPIIFIFKQFIILIPAIILFLFLNIKKKFKLNFSNKKQFFLIIVNFLPITLVLVTSLITGAKIRTMWMTPFYLFFGVFFIYIFQSQINLKKIKRFLYCFIFLFILSPSLYLTVSILNKDKRTDYPGREISILIQERWDKNFSNKIETVVGDEWFGGNLSYHLVNRPTWFNSLNKNVENLNPDGGIIYIGNPKILKKICPGVFGSIKPTGICMIGIK
ncbi:MAG: glycosyltransferase family 39 protein [Pelagibacteraceae bacterium]